MVAQRRAAVPDHADVINLVGSAQSRGTFYVGYEVKIHSPTSITTLDRVFPLGTDVEIETLALSYTTHSELVKMPGKSARQWMPCGLNLFSLHDGQAMLMPPLIITGNLAHATASFPIPPRRVSTLYLGLQTMGYGTFEIQIVGMGA